MYLYLKSTKANVQTHPVIKRLFEHRQLLLKLEPIFEEILKPQIEFILAKDTGTENTEDIKEKKKKTLKLLASLYKKENNKTITKTKRKALLENEKPVKKVKFADDVNEHVVEEKVSIEESSESEEDGTQVEEKSEEDNGNNILLLTFV